MVTKAKLLQVCIHYVLELKDRYSHTQLSTAGIPLATLEVELTKQVFGREASDSIAGVFASCIIEYNTYLLEAAANDAKNVFTIVEHTDTDARFTVEFESSDFLQTALSWLLVNHRDAGVEFFQFNGERKELVLYPESSLHTDTAIQLVTQALQTL